MTGAVIAIGQLRGAQEPEVAADSQTPAAVTADPVAGIWTGRAEYAEGGAFDVSVQVRSGCRVGERCGRIAVGGGSGPSCTGDLSLLSRLPDGRFEFDVGNFTADSDQECTEGAGEFLEPLDESTIRYTTSYGPAGDLTR